MLSFHVKFVQIDRRTDGQADKGKAICPALSIRGHKNLHCGDMKGSSGKQKNYRSTAKGVSPPCIFSPSLSLTGPPGNSKKNTQLSTPHNSADSVPR